MTAHPPIPTNGPSLKHALRRDLRVGAITAVLLLVMLYALAFGLRALGIGQSNAIRNAAIRADLDSLKNDVRIKHDTLEAILRRLELQEPPQ